jgi:hypothetical protein
LPFVSWCSISYHTVQACLQSFFFSRSSIIFGWLLGTSTDWTHGQTFTTKASSTLRSEPC